jgi:hypothetical protein
MIDIPVIINTLKEAEPIRAIGPTTLGTDSISMKVLKKHRKISGAAPPRVRSETLAIVWFQTGTSTVMS